MKRSSLLTLSPALLVLALPAFSSAQTITLRKNSVIPVVFDDSLSIKDSQVGERFHTFVENDPDIPKGTELNGQVTNIRLAKGKDPAAIELAFTDMTLPDGRHLDIDALVVPLDAKYWDKSSNGRLVAKPDSTKRGTQVLGGALGGLLIGSLIGKQLEATIAGTIVGILIAETDKSNDGNTVVKKGQKMGALLQSDFTVDLTDQDDMDDNANPPADRDAPPVDQRKSDLPASPVPPTGRNRSRDEKIIVTYGSRNLLWDRDKPYWDGDTAMVPLEHTAIQMGLRTAPIKDSDQSIFVDGRKGYLQIDVDSRTAKVNGRTVDLDVPASHQDRTIYVPLDLLVSIAKEQVYLNGDRVQRRDY